MIGGTAPERPGLGAVPDPPRLPERFNGPPGSAHGGYACGRFAAATGLDQRTGVAVTLLRPPPLAVPLPMTRNGERWHAWQGAEPVAGIAQARPDGGAPPPGVPHRTTRSCGAEDAATHPFPSCFVCGPQRADGDGLRLFPRVARDQPDTVVVTWCPAPEFADRGGLVRPEFLWAVLDCPGGWTVLGRSARAHVLNRIAVVIHRRPAAGSPVVIVGRLEGLRERTATVSTAAYHGAELLALARAQWTAVDSARFGAARGAADPS